MQLLKQTVSQECRTGMDSQSHEKQGAGQMLWAMMETRRSMKNKIGQINGAQS